MEHGQHSTLARLAVEEAARLRDAWLLYLIRNVPDSHALLHEGKIDTAIIRFARWDTAAQGRGRPRSGARKFAAPKELRRYLSKSPWKSHLRDGSLDEDEAIVMLGAAVGCLRDPQRPVGRPRNPPTMKPRGRPRKDAYALALPVWQRQGVKLARSKHNTTYPTEEKALEYYFLNCIEQEAQSRSNRDDRAVACKLAKSFARSRLRYARTAKALIESFPLALVTRPRNAAWLRAVIERAIQRKP